MKSLYCITALAATCCAYAQFDVTWATPYNGSANGQDRTKPSLVRVDKFGNTYIAGEAKENRGGIDTGIDMVVVKYSPSGSQIWARPILAVSNGTDIPRALEIDDFGNAYVTGESQNGPSGTAGNNQFRTAKLSAAGDLIWNKAFSYINPNTQQPQESRALDLAINTDGHVFVTGWTDGASRDILTIRYDETGALVSGWQNGVIYDGPGNGWDEGVAIAVGPSNNVYVTGIADRGTATGQDWVTLRYPGSGGSPTWARFVTGPQQGQKKDHPTDIVVDSQNRTFVCGVLYWNDGDSDAALVSYDISGNIRFNHANESALTFGLLQDSGYDGAAALDIEIDNVGAAVNVFVVGNAQPSLFSNDYLTLAYSAAQGTSGETWARTPTGAGQDMAFDVAVAGKGNVYVTGALNVGSTEDWFTIKYNQGGQLQHTATYTDNLAQAFGIADSCAGKTHVTGFRSTNSDDFWSILYTQTNRTNIGISSYTLFRGSNPSGNLASFQTSDNNRYTAQPGPVFTTNEYPVTIIVDGFVSSSLTVNEMCLQVESQGSATGILQRVDFYNFVTASWVQMDERFVTLDDSTVHLAAQYDPNEFLGVPDTPGGPKPIRARVMYKAGAPIFTYPWTARVDYLSWHTVD